MSGTTWKKKSRQGLPEVRKVGEWFSVKPIGVLVARLMVLKLATIWSMKGLLLGQALGSGVWSLSGDDVESYSSGGPRRGWRLQRQCSESAKGSTQVIMMNNQTSHCVFRAMHQAKFGLITNMGF